MRLVRLYVVLMVLALCLTPVLAQEGVSKYLHLYEVRVDSSKARAYEAYIKKIVEAAQKVDAPQKWMTFRGGSGTAAGTYFIAIPSTSWADMDGWKLVPQILGEAFGEAEAASILESGLQAMSSAEFKTDTWQLMPDYSTHFDASRYISNMYQIIRTEVKPEMAATYRSLLQRASKVAEGIETGPMTIRRFSTTGASFRFMAGTPFNKFAELDEMNSFWESMREQMGELAAEEFYRTLRASIVKREIFILMLSRDLSNLP